jgi:hypothetical protein
MKNILFIAILIACYACAESVETKELKISADRTAIEADGADKATFTVTYGGESVADAVIMAGDTALDGDYFSTRIDGEYKFTAAYNGLISNELTVTASTSIPPELPEATLARSITTLGYCEVTGGRAEYNGGLLSGSAGGLLRIGGNDTEVFVRWGFGLEDEYFDIIVPNLPVLGEPYNVRFDHEALDAYIHCGIVEYRAVVTVTGWMKVKGVVDVFGEYVPDYDCELQFDCRWGEGETLKATITSICFYSTVLVDDAGYGYFTWVNDSEHEIALTVPHYPYLEGHNAFEDEVVPPGGRFEMEVDGFVASPVPMQLAWNMTVSFDGGAHEITYELGNMNDIIPEDVYDSDCDPTRNENYVREDLNRYSPARTKWTYTFTNADYNAAVAYGRRVE